MYISLLAGLLLRERLNALLFYMWIMRNAYNTKPTDEYEKII
jgi:hypothetical protein